MGRTDLIAISGRIEERICLIRVQKVMLDADMPILNGVSPKQPNEQIVEHAHGR